MWRPKTLKDIIDSAMVSTPEEITDDSTSLPMTPTPVKKISARKSLCIFTNIFDVKKKTAKRHVGAAKYKLRSMKVGNILWTKKRKGHSKINEKIKRKMYALIIRHSQVLQSPVSNDCLKVKKMIRKNTN